jgi:hypothetical protein
MKAQKKDSLELRPIRFNLSIPSLTYVDRGSPPATGVLSGALSSERSSSLGLTLPLLL